MELWRFARLGALSTDTAYHDPYLSRLAFRRLSQRFPGQVIEEKDTFVLYQGQDVESLLMDDNYVPLADPRPMLQDLFIGGLDIAGGGINGISATTPLELEQVVERISDREITPVHINRDLKQNITRIDIAPETLVTRSRKVPR